MNPMDPNVKIETLITQAVKREHTAPDWITFLRIADRVAKDLQAANTAVKTIRSCLKSAKFSSSSAFPPQTPYYLLCLIGVLMKHAWLFILPFHQSDITDKLFPQTITKQSTHPALRTKMIALLHGWALYYRDSPHYPKFFLAFHALPPAHLDQAPVESFTEPFAPSEMHTATGIIYTLPSAALLPPFPTEQEDAETIATRTFRIEQLLDPRYAKFKLLEELLSLLDPPDLETNETVIESYPQCKLYHADVLRWIDEGQVSEPLLMKLFELNEQMLRILELYDRLLQGLSNSYPMASNPVLPDPPYENLLVFDSETDPDDQSRSFQPLITHQSSTKQPQAHPRLPSYLYPSSSDQIIVVDPSESEDHDFDSQSLSSKPLIR